MKHALRCALLVACSAILALGQSSPLVSFQAAKQTVDGSMLHLAGNVQIGTSQRSIQADEVDYNVTTGEIQAWGNVLLKTEGPQGRGFLRGDMISGSLFQDPSMWKVKQGVQKY